MIIHENLIILIFCLSFSFAFLFSFSKWKPHWKILLRFSIPSDLPFIDIFIAGCMVVRRQQRRCSVMINLHCWFLARWLSYDFVYCCVMCVVLINHVCAVLYTWPKRHCHSSWMVQFFKTIRMGLSNARARVLMDRIIKQKHKHKRVNRVTQTDMSPLQ